VKNEKRGSHVVSLAAAAAVGTAAPATCSRSFIPSPVLVRTLQVPVHTLLHCCCRPYRRWWCCWCAIAGGDIAAAAAAVAVVVTVDTAVAAAVAAALLLVLLLPLPLCVCVHSLSQVLWAPME
jgi:hypothetical protein